MKLLLLLSSLVAPALATLLIPKEEYIKHNLFKNSEDGKQCDDCCDNGVVLKHEVQFFGKKHSEFWPCANGLISFNAEVRDFTPEKFPVRGQPIVAAYWGDADLRTCRPDVNVRCSYWQVYYGAEANLLDAKITDKYFDGEQTFKAKVAIVQTWDSVGYYDLQTDKRNTFQIIVVSDGFENAFAGIYYGRIDWTTGDSSDGVDGLGGTPAQMGFDAGDEVNYYAHPFSQRPEVLQLENQEFLYAISKTKICNSGEQLIDNKCTPLSCSVYKPFPIKDANGRNAKKDNGLDNLEYKTPTNVVVGKCAALFVETSTAGIYKKAQHGTKCVLQCQYTQEAADQKDWLTYQPTEQATKAATDAGVTAECDASNWIDKAAKNCVEVGIEYKVEGGTTLSVREAQNAGSQFIEVSLKSKPHGNAVVIVDVKTSCKDGKPLKQRGENYYCNDKTGEPNTDTLPLASFKGGVYVDTVAFGPGKQAWNSPKKFEIFGTNNDNKAANGFEIFKISLSVRSSVDEACAADGCLVSKPYEALKKIETIDGKLLDDEGIELTVISLTTDESGKTAQFSIDPTVGEKSFIGTKITCKSSNPKEGKITGYQIEGETTITPITSEDPVTLTDKVHKFIVTGQPDNVVDGPKQFKIDCAADPTQGTILGLQFTNADVNIPGVIVDTSASRNFVELGTGDCDETATERDHKMPDGCGILQTSEKGGSDTFAVKLVTQPLNGDVFVVVTASDNTEVEVTPDSLKFDQTNWNVLQTFTVKGTGDDGELDGTILSDVDISVDTSVTTDKGFTTVQDGEPVVVLGYANCFGSRDKSATDSKKTRRRLQEAKKTQEELDAERSDIAIDCFSYDSSKIIGEKSKTPDASRLSIDVQTSDDTVNYTAPIAIAAGIIGLIIVIIVLVVIGCAVAAYFVALAIKKKRSEEAERKGEMKKDADEAEHEIAFHMDEEVADDMNDIEGVTLKLKGERDRLREENVKLAAAACEEPMECANTENPDQLVEQIKGLKGENDRLRDSATQSKPGMQRKKKKKASGFGQQQDE